MKKIAILMGSASDLPIAEDAAKTLEQLNIPFVVKVCSAHRTPDKLQAFAHSAREEDFGALICIAGLAAHLAGAAAAQTTLPVVGVPALSGHLGGMDALLSTVQMPLASRLPPWPSTLAATQPFVRADAGDYR